ncbi:hypothetical protein DCC39_12810 [Pueribacillus theae]|uniref:Uncharacterized protein n=1 Tax=Pueribacillus theae TaxID=2171751 RepID=A0A2U1JXN9_9BACI|nr:hypothetical protein [Pueribacillus theae]PWA09714.1 hypothetical protein DCC39_12810 [Pueribacillus theae]
MEKKINSSDAPSLLEFFCCIRIECSKDQNMIDEDLFKAHQEKLNPKLKRKIMRFIFKKRMFGYRGLWMRIMFWKRK